MDKKKKRVMKLTVLILIALLMIIACDMRLKTVTYQVSSDKITAPLTIILLTDLHGETYGNNQSKLPTANHCRRKRDSRQRPIRSRQFKGCRSDHT